MLLFGLAACEVRNDRFELIRGDNACDYTPIGPSYTHEGVRPYVGLRRARILEHIRMQGGREPILLARVAPPRGAAGEDIQRLALAWTPTTRETLVCHDDAAQRARVCIAAIGPSPLDLIAHFDADTADAELKTRTLVTYILEDVVCAPEGVTGEDFRR